MHKCHPIKNIWCWAQWDITKGLKGRKDLLSCGGNRPDKKTRRWQLFERAKRNLRHVVKSGWHWWMTGSKLMWKCQKECLQGYNKHKLSYLFLLETAFQLLLKLCSHYKTFKVASLLYYSPYTACCLVFTPPDWPTTGAHTLLDPSPGGMPESSLQTTFLSQKHMPEVTRDMT